MSHKTRTPFQKKHRPSENSDLFSVLLKNTAFGMLFALLCAATLSFIGSLVCLRLSDPLSAIQPMGLSILYVSALLGGILTVRRHEKKALLCGVLCGLFLLIFFWILSLFFRGDGSFSFSLRLLLRVLIVLFSILGACLGQKRQTRRPRRKR